MERMARRLHNWSYREITAFLKENGFSFFKPQRGSHERWIKRGHNGEADRIIGVNFSKKSYKTKTLRRMILQSGIDQAAWIEWAGS
jgi:predicted RNA binding protein YcfA (HicA-like mRNA interferase family)